MTKSATTKLLIVFHVVVFGAVFFRIDTFPLTWVPMYSQFHGIEELVLPVGDMARMKRGYEVVSASGEIDYVGPNELNIPKANFRRIYYQRSFGVGPPKHRREREALNPLSNWLFNLFRSDPATSIDWEARIMTMLNRTAGLTQDEPDYIVRATAVSDFATFTRAERRNGDLSSFKLTTRKAKLAVGGSP